MTDFAPLSHVALTVRDLAVSRPWYRALFGTGPVVDENTDAGYRPARRPELPRPGRYRAGVLRPAWATVGSSTPVVVFAAHARH